MITAAVLVAFFALLRSSEYTCPETRHYDPECTLCFQDVQFEGHFQFAQIRISKSKTGPFRLGCDIKVWRTGGRLCPLKALSRFIRHHPFRQGPLFSFRDGSYLTRTRLASIMRSVLHDVDLNTHSFRIGGVSAAAAAGIPDSTIQVMGRWASNAYRVYLRTPDTTFGQAAHAMSQRHVPKCCHCGIRMNGIVLGQYKGRSGALVSLSRALGCPRLSLGLGVIWGWSSSDQCYPRAVPVRDVLVLSWSVTVRDEFKYRSWSVTVKGSVVCISGSVTVNGYGVLCLVLFSITGGCVYPILSPNFCYSLPRKQVVKLVVFLVPPPVNVN